MRAIDASKPLFERLPARLSACSGVLVDSNVLLDVASNDPLWREWSPSALAEAAECCQLIINPIIYAEVSTNYATLEDLDDAIPATSFQRESLPWEARFLHWRSRGRPAPGAAHPWCGAL